MHKKITAFVSLCIIIIFCGIKFGILSHSNSPFETSFTIIEFIFWLISMSSIAIGALLYQDDEKGYQFFALSNFLGIGIAYYIGYRIDNFNLGTLTLIISALLFVFHSQLKNKALLGFLSIGFCASFSIIIYGVFELVAFIKQDPTGFHRLLFSIITDYSIYIFLISMPLLAIYNLNQSTKLQQQGTQNLEHLFGFNRSIKVIGFLITLPILACTYYLYTYLYQNNIALLFGLAFLMAPLLIASSKCFTAEKITDTRLILILLQVGVISSAFSLFIIHLSA